MMTFLIRISSIFLFFEQVKKRITKAFFKVAARIQNFLYREESKPSLSLK